MAVLFAKEYSSDEKFCGLLLQRSSSCGRLPRHDTVIADDNEIINGENSHSGTELAGLILR